MGPNSSAMGGSLNKGMSNMSQDWGSMTDEERQAMKMMGGIDISAEKVTNQMLKICNVVRNRMDVRNGDGSFMKKRSGLGGTGGRELSPDLRIRFGTFGFKNK